MIIRIAMKVILTNSESQAKLDAYNAALSPVIPLFNAARRNRVKAASSMAREHQ